MSRTRSTALRSTSDYDELKYVFIDDPVTSLDENHLIELAVNLERIDHLLDS